jgi:hypothetical protein
MYDQLTADIVRELAELRADAERYRWLRSRTRAGVDIGGRKSFVLPEVTPQGDILRGDVAQHLDVAIDVARG